MDKWFTNTLNRIMKYLDYKEDWTTSTVCDQNGKWTPCDLIAREYLNNGGGSAKGFLGISTNQCIKCYQYMGTIKQELIDNDLISIEAWNNSGFKLWTNYNFNGR